MPRQVRRQEAARPAAALPAGVDQAADILDLVEPVDTVRLARLRRGDRIAQGLLEAEVGKIDPARQIERARMVVAAVELHQLQDAVAAVPLELHAGKAVVAECRDHASAELDRVGNALADHGHRKADAGRVQPQLLCGELGNRLAVDMERIVVHAAAVIAGYPLAQHQLGVVVGELPQNGPQLRGVADQQHLGLVAMEERMADRGLDETRKPDLQREVERLDRSRVTWMRGHGTPCRRASSYVSRFSISCRTTGQGCATTRKRALSCSR